MQVFYLTNFPGFFQCRNPFLTIVLTIKKQEDQNSVQITDKYQLM